MKITRVINGKAVEIELTFEEMVLAAEAVREHDHAAYIKSQINDLSDDDDLAILKRLEGKALDEAIDELLVNFERLVEEEDYHWCDAWDRVSMDYAAKLAGSEN